MAYPFQLTTLPYAFDALEPTIDARTMEIHHDKHHAGYVNNLNAALKDHPELHDHDVNSLLANIEAVVPESIRTAVRNNGGGHANHSLFWEIMTPGGQGQPHSTLLEAINSTFGSFDELKTKVNEAGGSRFGSGWAWLVSDAEGKLQVMSTPNQDSPIMQGHTPILGVDVWEHAYYLHYQNRRPDYLKAWWDVVNWDVVERNYKEAR